uniref:Myb/SANT-like DNA-binding domain-containing protein n=1 Tax=Anopheles maculatus TaxID=74869 RepID=A0A182SY70_9DIPT
MSKSYEPQIKWRTDEVDELVASMKERDLLAQSDGKKRRSLEVFAVVRSDLVRKGIFRTEEQIRKKMNELRKQYFEANRSEPENRYELCEHYDALHDLFTDAQRKLDKRTERSRASRSKRRHSSQNGGQDVSHSVQVNLSKQNRGRSVSGSSVSSSGPSVHRNGGGEQNQQQQQSSQQNGGGETVPNGGRRNNSSPAQTPLPDKFHLKQCAYQPNLNNSLANLCKNDRYADVMLLVCNDHDSIAIPAHRLVLGTFSPVGFPHRDPPVFGPFLNSCFLSFQYFANVFEKFTFGPSTPIIY